MYFLSCMCCRKSPSSRNSLWRLISPFSETVERNQGWQASYLYCLSNKYHVPSWTTPA
ncbi:hypothetical protein Mapa_016219 [Marchantia paleacea]|nr:hypothetical protein Mapa_016219 [Marchantia paleacea]